MQSQKYVRIQSSAGHVIDIDFKYLLLIGETTLSFQFDFDWQRHSESCDDCGALFRAIAPNGNEGMDNNLTWYVFLDGKFKLIDFFRFGDVNDQEQGHLSFTSRSDNFEEEGKYINPNESLDITKVRLNLLSLEPGAIEAEKVISELSGNEHRCDYLNRALRQN